jgi:ketosteroid isomerase-like protein
MSLARQIGKAISDGDIGAIKGLLADDFVWHDFNPRRAEGAGDLSGLPEFPDPFSRLAYATGGTFKIETISASPSGDELLVTHVWPKPSSDGTPVEGDAVIVWRTHQGRIAEAWDSPNIEPPHRQVELDA